MLVILPCNYCIVGFCMTLLIAFMLCFYAILPESPFTAKPKQPLQRLVERHHVKENIITTYRQNII